MSEQQIADQFLPLYGGFVNLVELERRPLLAHYTSIDVLEKILRTNEIWMSCPLFMNDLQEMRFGLLEGRTIFDEMFGAPRADGEQAERFARVRDAFHGYFNDFDQNLALDVFVFCLAEHDPDNSDGLLSMWRGYGSQGNGAALIFNTDFISKKEESPLLIAKVTYSSAEERLAWLRALVEHTARVALDQAIPIEESHVVGFHAFQLMLLFSLTTKHHGFSEEQEWRVIYLPDRDLKAVLKEGFHYVVGRNGVEPKLRFPIKPLPFENPEAWTLDTILEKIILGPSISASGSAIAVKRMFRALNKEHLCERLVASGIPLRPIPQ